MIPFQNQSQLWCDERKSNSRATSPCSSAALANSPDNSGERKTKIKLCSSVPVLIGLCVHDNKEHEWMCHVIGPYRGQHVSCVALEDRRSAATRSLVMCPSDPR